MFGKKTIQPGGYLDFGGQWVGETQYEMKGLVAELGIMPFLSYEKGRSIQSWEKTKTGFNGDVAHLLEGICVAPDKEDFPQKYLAQCEQSTLPDCAPDTAEAAIWNKLLAISQTVPPDRPWKTPDAKSLDEKTFKDWLETEGAAGYTKWLPTMQSRIGGSGGFEPEQVSLLHMAWTQRVGPQSETPEKWLLCGGAGQIPQRLAKELGDCIRLSTPVVQIKQLEKGGVLVTVGADGRFSAVAAKAVIVAIPPSLRGKIGFDPPLDPKYTKFIEGAPMGSMSKVHAVYDKAFWRADCLSGSGAGNLKTCEFIADSSSPDGSPGILTSFIAGDRNRELGSASPAEIKDLVLADFVYYFGQQAAAANVNEFVHFNWDQQKWTGGAFTAHLGPGIWTAYGQDGWRKPVGDIFWAGTETSDRWPGYFDGAVRAGKMSVLSVLEKLYWDKDSCART
jgi:monoamine oxidase